MRLWHKDLIEVLPRQQLLGQWRECCAIAKSITEKGTPNHILVNKIMDYPLLHFMLYGNLVFVEMEKRGYRADFNKFSKYFRGTFWGKFSIMGSKDAIFNDWHNDRYLWQCYYNLQEKFDCNGITQSEWDAINLFFKSRYLILQEVSDETN